jgi:hypothetical protein
VLPLLAHLTALRAEDHTPLLTLSRLDRPVTRTVDRHSRHRHNPVNHKHRRSKAKHRRRKVNHSNLNHNLVKLPTRRQDSLISRRTIKLQERPMVSNRTLFKVNHRLLDL